MSTDCQINISVNLDLSPVNVAAQLALFNVGSFGVLSINGADGVVILNLADINDTSVTGSELDADNAKLALIEALADVTDAANVAAAIPATGGYLAPNAITFADPFTVDVDNGTVQTITLTASTTLTAITNAANGQSGRLEITQGGIGGFVVTLPAAYTLRSGDEATISDLATGETAIVAWSTIDGSDFNLWIS